MESHVLVNLSSKAVQKIVHAVTQMIFIIYQFLYAVARIAVSYFATLSIFKINVLNFMKQFVFTIFLQPVKVYLMEHNHGNFNYFDYRHYLK